MRRLVVLILCLFGAAGLSACAKPDLAWSTLEARYANPASRYMDLPGGLKVHYRDEGDPAGRPLVMVHGFAASLHAWEPWVARLRPGYRLISLDLPVHGLTRAPDAYVAGTEGFVEVVDDVTRRLGVQRFILAGNSMGGAVAWNYALAHPERLEALVLVDAAGYPAAGDRKGSPLVFKLLANPIGRAVLERVDPRPLAERGLKQAYLDPALVTPALVDRYADFARAPGRRTQILNMQGGARRSVTLETFAGIKTPTLVMSGEQDALIPVAAARGLAAAIPGARLITYPGVGHVPMEQIPDRSAQDLKVFLASVPAS